MSDTWIHLSDAVVFRVSGKDARRYLNNRLSNDLRSARPGEVVCAAALTPQGRVEGLFSVFVENAESFLLICDGGKRNTLLAALSRYIVADRVSIEDLSLQSVVIHVVSAQPLAFESATAHLIPHARVSASGYDCVFEGAESVHILARCTAEWGEPLSGAQYALLRWKQGIPAYPIEINEDIILTEADMRHAVSFTKGCYVGQEVIERSDAIGKLPRTLARIRFTVLSSKVAPGSPVSVNGTMIGKVVSCMRDTTPDFCGAFALLRSSAYAPGVTVSCGQALGIIMAKEEVVS